ncbi:MAG: sulfatase-like hydrolase/transferase [Thermoanaerobaculia bacterium]
MSPKKLIEGLSWGALLGAFLGCLIGLAEFAAIFLRSEASYSGSLPLAYRHIVYPFAVLGTLLGMGSAGIAVCVALVKGDTESSGPEVNTATISVLVGLISFAYLSTGWVLMPRSFLSAIPRSVLLIAAFLVAGLAGAVTHRTLARFSFSKRPGPSSTIGRSWLLNTVLLGTILSVVAVPAALQSPSTPSSKEIIDHDHDRPNVVLILVDTLRADHLSVYGYSRRTTPNLEEFARTAVVFTQASAASSWTKPSVATIFSSLYPVTHKARTNQDFLSGSVLTLAEALRDSGYVTLGVTANPLIAPTFGFTQGFMEFSAPETISPFRLTTVGRLATRLSNRLRAAESRDHEAERLRTDQVEVKSEGKNQGADRQRGVLGRSLRTTIRRVTSQVAEVAFGEKVGALPPGDGITDTALRMAERNQDAGPLLLYVHYIDPHVPYSPPAPYDSAFSQHADSPLRQSGVDARSLGATPEDQDWIGRSVDLYDGEVLFVDLQIGRLLGGLEDLGLLETAVVVVTSDHGEEFLDHGGTKHGRTLYEEVLRVPLLMRVPNVTTLGLVHDQPVGLIDLMPTILELARAEKQPQLMQGRSLVADLLEGTEPKQVSPYFGQVLQLEMARVDQFKVIRTRNRKGSEEIYDLSRDPLEKQNLANGSEGDFVDLLAAFEELASETESIGPNILQQTVAEEEEALEALRALGYIE